MFFHNDGIDFAACNVIESNTDFLESKFSVKTSAFWILLFDVELDPSRFRERTPTLFHQPLPNPLSLKVRKHVEPRDRQTIAIQMRGYHSDNAVGAAFRYTEECRRAIDFGFKDLRRMPFSGHFRDERFGKK